MAYLNILGSGPSKPDTGKSGRNRRRRASILFQYISTWALVDATPDIEEQLEHALSVTHVLLTRSSRTTAAGLKRLDAWLTGKTPVFASEALWASIEASYGPFEKLHHEALKDYEATPMGDLTVTAVPLEGRASASESPLYAYLFDTGKKKALYAPSFKQIPDVSLPYFRDNQLLLVDGAGWTSDSPSHVGALNHLSDYLASGNEQVIFTQLGSTVPPHTLARSLLRQRSAKADLAYDFMKLPFGR